MDLHKKGDRMAIQKYDKYNEHMKNIRIESNHLNNPLQQSCEIRIINKLFKTKRLKCQR